MSASKLVLIIVLTLALAACKKNVASNPGDTTPPEITLWGYENDTVPISDIAPVIDAVAIDDKDGDISAKIEITGNLNLKLKGKYTRIYNVKDAAGNSAITKTRNVDVINEAEFLAGNYYVFCTSSVPKSAGSSQITKTYISYTTSAVASGSVNSLVSVGYFPVSPFTLDVILKEYLLLSPKVTGTGSGTVTSNKQKFNLVVTSTMPYTGLTQSCSCSFDRIKE